MLIRDLARRITATAAAVLLVGSLSSCSMFQSAPDDSGLPTSVDLTADAMPAGNQTDEGTCNAWRIDYSLMGWWALHQHVQGVPFSVMFAYTQAGTSTDGIYDVLENQGVMPAAQYWQGQYDDVHKPDAAERKIAASYKVSEHVTLFDSLNAKYKGSAIKRVLASGRPVALTLWIYQAHSDNQAQKDYDWAVKSHDQALKVYNRAVDDRSRATGTEIARLDRLIGPLKQALDATDGRVAETKAALDDANRKFDDARSHTFDALDADHSVLDKSMANGDAGQHGLLALGYDSQGVIVENSWGQDWGREGFATVTWDYIEWATAEASYNNGFTSAPGLKAAA